MVGNRWMFRCRWDPLGRSEESFRCVAAIFSKRACERWATNWRFHSFSFRVFAFSLEGYKTTRLVGLDWCCHLPFFPPKLHVLSSRPGSWDFTRNLGFWCRIWRHPRDAVGPTVAWISPQKYQVWLLLSAPWDDDNVDVDVGKMMLEK